MSKDIVKGGFFVLLMLLILVFNANRSSSSSVKSNNSNSGSSSFQCSGGSSIHDCLIADHESLEFLLGSEIAANALVTGNALIGSHPIVDCRPGHPYRTCLPNPYVSKVGEPCTGLYRNGNRGCR
ncbi:hypothetical protein ACOSP7_028162 [Xanthoceras sorbifolium]|uniref:Uncharacterized protein n=1 Tax=Xanthoceras sorbifolium TaxID=99658 RepID=A0ABQ8HDH6_9ROSI|nr:hypothetical protein JRO89_XS12G0218100 [Xanthoceras sorbifolium]